MARCPGATIKSHHPSVRPFSVRTQAWVQQSSISEHLSNAPRFCLVQRSRLIDALLGAGADLTDAATWRCPYLADLGSATQLKRLVGSLFDLPTHEDRNGPGQIDLDDAIGLIIDYFHACARTMQAYLAAAFSAKAALAAAAAAADGGGNVHLSGQLAECAMKFGEQVDKRALVGIVTGHGNKRGVACVSN